MADLLWGLKYKYRTSISGPDVPFHPHPSLVRIFPKLSQQSHSSPAAPPSIMSSSGSSNENYMLIACGSTHYAPFLAGWQEFKDSLRKIVEYQPGWTVVEPKAGRRRGEMQGWSRIERKDDAEVAYGIYALLFLKIRTFC
jgi:hypothetical protein